MATATIFIRSMTQRDGGFESHRRAAAIERWVREVSPTSRVTVFASGGSDVQEYLYTRVRDLVALPADATAADDAWALGTRGRADLVLYDGGAPEEERRETWRR